MDTIEATNTLANLKKASEAINMAIRALEVTADPDTVSRKQAIDALKEAFNPSITNFVKARLAIENLPSAQPEIIRCKECKYAEHWYRDKARCFLWHETGIDVYEDGFCNYAKRKNDE